jgi:hypothetical protein
MVVVLTYTTPGSGQDVITTLPPPLTSSETPVSLPVTSLKHFILSTHGATREC